MTNQLSFEDEYFNVLLSIESAIYSIYQENTALVDFNVDKALNGVVRTLSNEKRNRKPPNLKLKGDEQRIFDRLMRVANLFLSREDAETYQALKSDIESNIDDETFEFDEEPLTIDEMIACFKRIQRSVKLMSDQGRQGYLNFIKQFFGGDVDATNT